MSLFSGTVAALLNGDKVNVAYLIEMQFASETSRLWTGFGDLTTNDARTWKGTGELVAISGLSTRTDSAADKVTLTASGVDPTLISVAKDSANQAKGRPCFIYLQTFDSNHIPLDVPVAIKSGLMDVVTYQSTGIDKRQLSVTVEGLFASRLHSPFSYWSDRDQQARFPGDLGCQFVPSLRYFAVVWPG